MKLGVVNVDYGGRVNFYIILLVQVLEVMKKIITSVSYSEKLDEVILDRLLSDSSIHSKLPKHWRDFISAGSLI
ncbi:hypothetical protein EV1_003424 [Malus domestica]